MTLVFIHGAASTPDVWIRQRRAFPRARRVALPDLAASIGSDGLLSHYASHVLSTVPGSLVLVGHSLGGAVALLAAQACPTRVAAVVLAASAPRLPVNPALLDALRDDPNATLLRIADWSLAREADPTLREVTRLMMTRQDPRAVWTQFDACRQFAVAPESFPHQIPVSALVGSEDRMTPPALVRELLSWRPGSSVTTIPDAGHLLMMERPARFNAALIEQLRAAGLWDETSGWQDPLNGG